MYCLAMEHVEASNGKLPYISSHARTYRHPENAPTIVQIHGTTKCASLGEHYSLTLRELATIFGTSGGAW